MSTKSLTREAVGSWRVRVRVVTEYEIVCRDCTEQEARSGEPEFIEDYTEGPQTREVTSIKRIEDAE